MEMHKESFFNNLGIVGNNNKTNALLRIGYFCWVINGRNDLKSLASYVDKEFECEFYDKDLDGVVGAIGTRFRNWMTSDSVLTAYKKNTESTAKGIDGSNIIAKPAGFDQLEHAFHSISERTPVTTCSFYMPEIDLKTPFNNVDLINASFVLEENTVDMVLNFTDYDSDGYQVNEVWAMMIMHRLLCQMTNNLCGRVHINACRTFNKGNLLINTMSDCPAEIKENHYTSDDFNRDCVLFTDFEKHLKMQVNVDTVNNPTVIVPELIEKLEAKLINTITGSLFKDLAKALLILTIKKYMAGNEYYDDMKERLRASIISTNIGEMVDNG